MYSHTDTDTDTVKFFHIRIRLYGVSRLDTHLHATHCSICMCPVLVVLTFLKLRAVHVEYVCR